MYKSKKISLLVISLFLTSCMSAGGITKPDGVLKWTMTNTIPTFQCGGPNYHVGDTIYKKFSFTMQIDFSQLVDEVVKVEVKNNKNNNTLTHVFRYPSDIKWIGQLCNVKYKVTQVTDEGECWACAGNITNYTQNGWTYGAVLNDTEIVEMYVYYNAK